MKLSNRVLEMEESVTLAAGARAKALKAEGRDILSLTLGEPDFTTPKNIQDGVNTFVYVLVLMGVVNDPTTTGLTDSKQAIEYEKPKGDDANV